MSRSKKTIITDDFDEKPVDEQKDADDTAIEEAARDFAEGERMIKLYRTSSDYGGRPKFLSGLAREDFNELIIQERFGGGRYFGRWKKKDGTYKRYQFDIEGEPKNFVKPPVSEPEQDPAEAYRYAGPQSPDAAAQPQAVSAFDMLRIMAETRREAREEMRMMLEMFKPAPAAPAATEQVFSLVEKIVPLIQGGGDGSGGNPWLFALAQLKEPLMKMVDTIHVAVTKGPVAPAPAPAPSGKRIQPPGVPGPGAPIVPEPPAVPVEPPQPENEDAMLLETFRGYLPILVKAASVNGDPSVYADMILDQVPAFGYDRLRTWLMKPGCLEDLAKMDVSIYAQQAWWETLRSMLLEALNEELGHGVRSIQPGTDSNPSTSGATPGDEAS
jgi:hypothetical protein